MNSDGSRMALPIELDMIRVVSRVNELEHQVEVIKSLIKKGIKRDECDEFHELKVLINKELFHE